MNYFILSIAILAIMLVFTAKIPWLLRFLVALAITAVTWFVFYVLDVTVRAVNIPWYEDTPWKQLIALFLTMFGMADKYLFDVIKDRKQSKSIEKLPLPLKFDIWEFIQPFLVSFIVFGAFWNMHGDEELKVTWLVISFQNGFFWQTVLKLLKAPPLPTYSAGPMLLGPNVLNWSPRLCIPSYAVPLVSR